MLAHKEDHTNMTSKMVANRNNLKGKFVIKMTSYEEKIYDTCSNNHVHISFSIKTIKKI